MATTTLQALVKDVYGNSTLSPTVATATYPPEVSTLSAVTNFLNTFYIWVIFAVGIPGNILSVMVIIGMSKQRLTTSFLYVAVLSIVDSLTIILKVIDNQLQQKKFLIDETGCQFLVFFGLTCSAFANWILIIISTERFTAVAFPMKVELIWSLKKAVGILVGVFLFLAFIHSHIFVTITHYESYTCTVKEEFHQYLVPWYFISATIYSFLPAVSIIIFNSLIILLLRKYSIRRRRISVGEPAQEEAQRQERQITIMLVTIAVVFVILTIPRCVYVILHHTMCSDTRDFMCLARKQFFNIFTSQLTDTNHAINFYLYFLSGSKFREEFLKLFRCVRVPYMDVSNGSTQVSEIPVAESGI